MVEAGLRASRRALGGRRRHDPARPRDPPDLRPADRVLAGLARDRGRDPAPCWRARHRRDRLRRALARPAQRPLEPERARPARRTSAATRHASPATTSSATSSWSTRCARSPTRRARRSRRWRSRGCSRAAMTWCRSSGPARASDWPSRSARSSSSSPPTTSRAIEAALPAGRGGRRRATTPSRWRSSTASAEPREHRPRSAVPKRRSPRPHELDGSSLGTRSACTALTGPAPRGSGRGQSRPSRARG